MPTVDLNRRPEQGSLFELSPDIAREKFFRVVKAPHRAMMNLKAEMLSLPLFPAAGVNQQAPQQVSKCEEVKNIALPDKLEWSEKAVEDLHSGLLARSLELLREFGNGEQKQDILEWIFSPDVFVSGQRILDTKRIPLTFQCCCWLEGYDPGQLRERLIWQMPEELRNEFRPFV